MRIIYNRCVNLKNTNSYDFGTVNHIHMTIFGDFVPIAALHKKFDKTLIEIRFRIKSSSYSVFRLVTHFLPPEMVDLCIINSTGSG